MDAFLHRDGCIGQEWIYEIDDDGRLRAWSGGSDPDVFHLWIRFGNEPTQPPTMTIEVKGKAAAIFMSFWMTLNLNSNPEKHPGKEELRKKAGIVLDSIVKNLKTKLTILRPEKGRPSSNLALARAREAVDIRRELAVAQPAAFRSYLATSLLNLMAVFMRLEQPGEALARIEEL